jgi:hypothetical protein
MLLCLPSNLVSRWHALNRRSTVDDEIVQEFHVDRLSDASCECESDKSSNVDDEVDDDLGPPASHEGRKRPRIEVRD